MMQVSMFTRLSFFPYLQLQLFPLASIIWSTEKGTKKKIRYPPTSNTTDNIGNDYKLVVSAIQDKYFFFYFTSRT